LPAKDPEQRKATSRDYRIRNLGAIKEKQKAYRARPEVRERARLLARAHYKANREKALRKMRSYRAGNRQRFAERRRHRAFGVGPEAYQKLLAEQDGLCAICRVAPAEAIDHDHQCCPRQQSCGRCVRGLLCGNCNKGLGNFQDDPELLAAARDYLLSHPVEVIELPLLQAIKEAALAS
jgi:hypothetical protein